jgi:hypothetical protein
MEVAFLHVSALDHLCCSHEPALAGHFVPVQDAKQVVAINAIYQDKHLFDRTMLIVTVPAYVADVWPHMIMLMLLCKVRGHGLFQINPFHTRLQWKPVPENGFCLYSGGENGNALA